MKVRYHFFGTDKPDRVEEVSDLSAIPRKDEYVEFETAKPRLRVYEIVWHFWKKPVEIWIGLTKT